ncbi:MAG: SIMPL domain-containing protein [Clostridia bacterium]|nr:SIMPL domain-containing protein [Clostridia bacterium]
MKKLISLAIALAMICVCAFALAETRIAVNGTGETQISADTAIISLGVSARDKDVLKAQQKVNTAIASIRKALIEQGVKEENINTDYINIYARYDYTGDDEQVIAYGADSTLAIKVTDIASVGSLIDVSFAAGANTLNGITFSASDTDGAKAESLKKAVADAKAKAEILAEAAGLKISGIETISEGGAYSYSNTVSNFSAKRMDAAEYAADAGTVVQAAKLIVSASVSITFTAE